MDGAQTHLKRTAPAAWLQRHRPATLVIFRALQLGDMLCAIPALRALRTALPDTRITLVGLPWAAQFAQRYSHYIDDFFAFPGHAALPEQTVKENLVPVFYASMRERQFDLALQMHGSGEVSNTIVHEFGARRVAGFGAAGTGGGDDYFYPFPKMGAEPLRLLQLTEMLGAPPIGTHLEFPLTAADEHELDASGVASTLAPGSYFCIHPGARMRDKCWPPERFAWVADQLAAEFRLTPVLTGAASEAELTAAVARHMRSAVIDTAVPLSIGAMAALMSRSRLLVCNDTGVSHIAAGLKLNSVVIFSKADKRRWAPLDQKRHRCLWDPAGARADEVVQHARQLLAGAPN
jgi:ADP-heptose:LPS heptosyltransferase